MNSTVNEFQYGKTPLKIHSVGRGARLSYSPLQYRSIFRMADCVGPIRFQYTWSRTLVPAGVSESRILTEKFVLSVEPRISPRARLLSR
eukprot:COSAG02_NODE_2152_length_9655_cov_6.433654_6_plen_89_part_00